MPPLVAQPVAYCKGSRNAFPELSTRAPACSHTAHALQFGTRNSPWLPLKGEARARGFRFFLVTKPPGGPPKRAYRPRTTLAGPSASGLSASRAYGDLTGDCLGAGRAGSVLCFCCSRHADSQGRGRVSPLARLPCARETRERRYVSVRRLRGVSAEPAPG